GHDDLVGQAHYRGPVIVSWTDALAGSQNEADGINTVLHEFAHELDFLDGEINGTPRLRDRSQYRIWREVMTQEYQRLVKMAEKGAKTLLDPYGAKDEAEFFAVATECFFEKPVELAKKHSRLYELLRDYYRQDPARRFQVNQGTHT